MPLLADDPRTLGQQLADLAARVTTLGAAVDAEIAALTPPAWDVSAVRDADPSIVHVSWAEVPGSLGYVVARNGVDNRGNGPWGTLDPATARSRDLIWLTASTTEVVVVAIPSGLKATLSL